jgi:hypothetical protein
VICVEPRDDYGLWSNCHSFANENKLTHRLDAGHPGGLANRNDAWRHAVKTRLSSEDINLDLRQFAPTAATGCVAIAVAGAMFVSSALAQSAREVRGPTPYFPVENEPPPKLIVDPALSAPLALGLVQIQYRVENVRILPVFGAAAVAVSPRVGHLHISVDDLPWLWADASDLSTVDIAGLPPGPHSVRIELVNANHQVFNDCATCRQTVAFTVPAPAKMSHDGASRN